MKLLAAALVLVPALFVVGSGQAASPLYDYDESLSRIARETLWQAADQGRRIRRGKVESVGVRCYRDKKTFEDVFLRTFGASARQVIAYYAGGRDIHLRGSTCENVHLFFSGQNTVKTAGAYAIYTIGLRDVPASAAGVASLAEPLTATLLGVVLFGERLGTAGVIGAVLLFTALGISVVGVRRLIHPVPVDGGWVMAIAALSFAANLGIALLLQHGADPNKAGAPWATPLAWARKKGHRDIVADLQAAASRDKKVRAGVPRFVVLRAIGSAAVEEVGPQLAAEAFRSIGAVE